MLCSKLLRNQLLLMTHFWRPVSGRLWRRLLNLWLPRHRIKLTRWWRKISSLLIGWWSWCRWRWVIIRWWWWWKIVFSARWWRRKFSTVQGCKMNCEKFRICEKHNFATNTVWAHFETLHCYDSVAVVASVCSILVVVVVLESYFYLSDVCSGLEMIRGNCY